MRSHVSRWSLAFAAVGIFFVTAGMLMQNLIQMHAGMCGLFIAAIAYIAGERRPWSIYQMFLIGVSVLVPFVMVYYGPQYDHSDQSVCLKLKKGLFLGTVIYVIWILSLLTVRYFQ